MVYHCLPPLSQHSFRHTTVYAVASEPYNSCRCPLLTQCPEDLCPACRAGNCQCNSPYGSHHARPVSHYLSDTHFFCKYTEKTLAVQLLTDKNIPESAFAGCTSLESVTLNSVVKEIQSKAFYGCNALTAASNFIRRLTAGSHLHS